MKKLSIAALLLAGTFAFQEGVSQRAPKEQVGPLGGGGFLLNSGWKIQPAGQQVPVDTFPMSSALSNDGKYLLVLNGGYNPPTISVIELAGKRELHRTAVPDAWLGLAVAPEGNLIYVGGGSTGNVYELSLGADGTLTRTREISLTDAKTKGKPFAGDVALSPDGLTLYAADLYGDSIAQVNLKAGKMVDHWKTGQRPYRIVVAPGGALLLISSWGDAAIYQHAAASGVEAAKVRVGPHPTDMLLLDKPAPTESNSESYRARVFVAAANTNNVYSFGLGQDGQMTMLESINVSMTPMHPLGMTPSALAVDKQGSRLYVVCSDANAVAVVDISGPRAAVLGFIPTGWYPTAARVLPDDELTILNGKGLGSKPNPNGPNPTKGTAFVQEGERQLRKDQYVAALQTGTVAFLPQPPSDQIRELTHSVMANSPYHDEMIYGPITNDQEAYFSRTQGHQSPIHQVIYIIKENRTYDQVLGDIEKGNGDKTLTLFGERVTPNLHALARDFVLFDNFYENSDVSADGHNWATAAIAPDYTVKLWPNEYGHRSKVYDFEGGEPANTPPAGYIWNNALQAGVTVRNYGDWVVNFPLNQVVNGRQIRSVRDHDLEQHTDFAYRGFDLEYSDMDRVKEFTREWDGFAAANAAPQISVVRLGNDHTQGTKPGALTPLSYAAQNDLAVGTLVDAVSHSRLWSSTAIFVIEDDSQNGPDHIDSHRAPVWVISPFTRRSAVDSTMYNQAGVLRTIELIAGLRPMTHFDAGARPLFASFSQQADARPFSVITAQTSLTERNSGNAAGANDSARMNFSDADLADDEELNAILWRAIKHGDPPVPVRSAFGR
jgi:DNA-binding beta-propeller fold protein YncE